MKGSSFMTREEVEHFSTLVQGLPLSKRICVSKLENRDLNHHNG